MKYLKEWKEGALINILIFFLIIFSSINIKLSAEEINWTEVANTNSEKQFIETKSIKYNNNNQLSVSTKYSQVNSDDQKIIKSSSYLMAIDCENRLFSKLPLNSELKQVQKWSKPSNNKLIKNTIIKSCSY